MAYTVDLSSQLMRQPCYKEWVNTTDVSALADTFQVMIVTPSGGRDSWYIDSPVKKNSQFETYIYKDVIGFIDQSFRTAAEKNARAITGFSMGGFGALNIAINHNGVFGAVGSVSGGVDPRPFHANWGLEAVLGSIQKHQQYWDDKAIINNAPRLLYSGLAIYLESGVDDFFIESNRQLRARLLALKIPHHYSERPGAHNKTYYAQAVELQVQFFSQRFKEKGVARVR